MSNRARAVNIGLSAFIALYVLMSVTRLLPIPPL
jgi:hypothetical protein